MVDDDENVLLQVLDGEELTVEYMQKNGFDNPIMVKQECCR